MDKSVFLSLFEDAVMVEKQTLLFEMALNEIENWDSLALVSLLTDIEEKYSIKTEALSFKGAKTVEDIYNVVVNTQMQ
ncbi:hypothetical protein [Bacillus sp. 3255]|uniref:hypothetical protein n=1 Tax=Bacillus sp. 3255 TaxID=2817904 RepID=UPI002865FEAA|nr:hypothetical protein [Bacillus sp. 3255]MDR6883466.1 acyl carrier protein [Bacillus sp. 3255]